MIVTAAANGLDDDLTQMVATGVGVNAVSNYLKCYYSLSLSPPGGRRRLRLSALVQVAPMTRGRSESVRIFSLARLGDIKVRVNTGSSSSFDFYVVLLH